MDEEEETWALTEKGYLMGLAIEELFKNGWQLQTLADLFTEGSIESLQVLMAILTFTEDSGDHG